MDILRNFVVFEGADGTGTSTQIELLKARFDKTASAPDMPLPPLWCTCEPTEGPVGRLIRSCLKGDTAVLGGTMARLFAADRSEHLYTAGGIVERTARGELVVSDRYTPSSLVYQGIVCGADLPRALNEGFPVPELIVLLDLESEIAAERMKKRGGRREIYEYLDFQVKVRAAYRSLIPYFRERGSRVETIDAAPPPEEVAAAVWSILQKMPTIKG